MTVEKILKAVVELVGAEGVTVGDGTSRDEVMLVRCLNVILQEIAEEYVDFVRIREARISGGKIAFSELQGTVRRVKSVLVNGIKRSFTCDEDGIYLGMSDGLAKVTYVYVPDEVRFDSVLSLPKSISERALVYGTASEYCLMKEMYEECVNLNSRYVRSITACTRVRREIRVKKRSWL